MHFSDETVAAYADGELDAATRAAIDAALPQDPELAARVARQRALRERLRRAFEPVLAEPVPERLLALARTATQRPAPGAAARTQWSSPQWLALAASLVVGALLGPWLIPVGIGPGVSREDELLAGPALQRALSEQLASNQAAAAPVQIGVSFRAHDGRYCRTFVLQGKSALAGLACRAGEIWRLRALASTASVAQGGYRPAAAPLPPPVAQAVDELITAEPLDARDEAAARERGWR
jgi:hypothetical protein